MYVFVKEKDWLGFHLFDRGSVTVTWKIESIVSLNKPKNIINVDSLFGSMNNIIRFMPSLAATTEPFRTLLRNVQGSNKNLIMKKLLQK